MVVQKHLGVGTYGASVVANGQCLMYPLSFTGTLTTRVHKVGNPYEHDIFDIQSRQHKLKVQFNAKCMLAYLS